MMTTTQYGRQPESIKATYTIAIAISLTDIVIYEGDNYRYMLAKYKRMINDPSDCATYSYVNLYDHARDIERRSYDMCKRK